jgi:predicted Na+-dependent transporter
MVNFADWNKWMGKRMFLGVLVALAVGFNCQVAYSPGLRIALIALFGYMTFVTGLETSLRRFFGVLSRPWVPLWILLLVHFVTPLVAWLVGYIFFPNDIYVRMGYLIAAAIPVGVTSIMWTSLGGGNVPVSLVAVTLDTLIVPVLLPAFFLVAVGQAVALDYRDMMLQLLWMITIPSVAGMIIHDLSGGRSVAFAKGFGGLSGKLAFFIMIFLNAAIVGQGITWSPAILKMLVVTLFLVALGYCIGYWGAFAVKGRPADITVAMVFSVGLRNIAAGLLLAIAYFPPAVAVPITLFIIFQQPLATLVPLALRRLGRDCRLPGSAG